MSQLCLPHLITRHSGVRTELAAPVYVLNADLGSYESERFHLTGTDKEAESHVPYG